MRRSDHRTSYYYSDVTPSAPTASPSPPVTHDEWLAAYHATPERDAEFVSLSGEEVRPLYTEADVPAQEEIGLPGQYPFTRGVYPSMYRGRLWTMRQFAGFGTAEETNERFHYLLEHGQTGLSTAFDMPSLMGHDSDSPQSLGEVGREGVAVDIARRHAGPVRGHRPRRGLGVDDDQRAGRDHDGLLRRRRRGPGRSGRPPRAAPSRRTSSRSTSPRRSGASRSIRRCG